MEGFGNEVLFTSTVILGLFFLLLILCVKRRREVITVTGPAEYEVRPVVVNQPCPICLESMILPVETNCGHVFCGNCLRLLHESRTFFRQMMPCPLCRQGVTMLFPCFSREPPAPNPASGDASGPTEEMIEFTTFYNNLFGDESFWNLIRNSPILIRHYFNRVLEQGLNVDPALVNGLLFMGVIILYLLLPFDLVPESAFGLLGYFDDIIFAIYWVLYVCRLYRHYIT